MRPLVIAIDGPAGSGKSSVSRRVASRLGLLYLDTGAMYRAMTVAVLDAGVDVDDAAAVAEVASSVIIVNGNDATHPTVHVNGKDVETVIRGDEVTDAVSAVSAVQFVRDRLVQIQRDTVKAAHDAGKGIVVEGRDITTVVLPDADLKIFITADPDVRARRRAAQDERRGKESVDVNRTQSALLERDAKDSGRKVSPLSLAEDAVLVDTTELTLDEVIDRVCALADAISG